MEKLLISACLLGCTCRYDGASRPLTPALLEALRHCFLLYPVCQEQAGGLPTPRLPCERQGRATVSNYDGEDVGAAYAKGARAVYTLCCRLGCSVALFKERSPSCGVNFCYDGSFSGRLIQGEGITTHLLRSAGIQVYSEEQIFSFLSARRLTHAVYTPKPKFFERKMNYELNTKQADI